MNRAADDPATHRIVALDLIRGIAVLGILPVNIAVFSGPTLAALTPHALGPASVADQAVFAGVLLLFEGKMRLLFTLLFGASMLLFIDRAEARGLNGARLQLRRLGWLALFGWLHYALLWHGDILLLYALIGLIAFAMRKTSALALAIIAIAFFLFWHLIGMAGTALQLAANVTPAQAAQAGQAWFGQAAKELAVLRDSFGGQVWHRVVEKGAMPFTIALMSLGETLPLMLLGMAAYRSGLFAGAWPRRRLVQLTATGLLLGGALTALLVAQGWRSGFAPPTMFAFILYWLAIPHLLLGLGYLAGLMLVAPRLLQTRLGERLAAAGRMAFSNYIGSSIVMTAIFSGWGAALAGRYSHAVLPLFVLGAWLLMLAWSKPWLAHFRQGPLEWLWRSLTEWRLLPFKR